MAKDCAAVETSNFSPRLISLRSSLRKFWLKDIIALLLAAASTVAIFAILKAWDGHDVLSWKWGISLNAIVSIFTTVLCLFLTVPISSCLGQFKWNQFAKSQPLYNFYILDEASKTLFGSIRLLFYFRSWQLFTVVAAVLTIAVQAIGPFMQQIISLESRSIVSPSSEASLQVLHSYDGGYQNLGSTNVGASISDQTWGLGLLLPVKRAIYDGLFADQTLQSSGAFTCSSGNCTWENYHSVGICSVCEDISDAIRISYLDSVQGRYSNIDGGLSTFSTNFNVTASAPSHAFGDSSFVLADYQAIYIADGTNLQPTGSKAMECLLQMCVREHSATFLNGKFQEVTLGHPLLNWTPTAQDDICPSSSNPRKDWVDGAAFCPSLADKWYTLNSTESDRPLTYAFNAMSALAFAQYFEHYFSYNDDNNNPSDIIAALRQAMTEISGSNVTMSEQADIIANSLTNFMRSQSKGSVGGVSTVQAVYIHVQWRWITLPVTLLVWALALLVFTIYDTKRKGIGVWRGSSLATLIHGVDDQTRRTLTKSTREDGMEREAKHRMVRLTVTDESVSLVED